MINKDIYIAPYENTRWLVLSSLFFTIPSIYAFINSLYNFSILLLFTSLISINYWRKATYSWRRNMDLIFAKLSFIIFLFNGIFYVRSVIYLITGYTGLIFLLYCYYLSAKLLKLKNNNWYKYHMVFHLIMTYEQIIIIDSILQNGILQNGIFQNGILQNGIFQNSIFQNSIFQKYFLKKN